MSIGAGIAGGIASIISGGFNRISATDMMDYEYELKRRQWIESLTSGPSLQMEGYRKAGINPLLALGHSADSMAAVGSQQAPTMDLNSAVQAAMQSKQLELQEEAVKADANLKNAQADEITTDIGLKQSQKTYQDLVNKWFPKKSKAEQDKITAEIGYLKQQSKSLQLDSDVKEELAKGNEYWKKKLGDGVAYKTLYQLGKGNIAEGGKIVLAGAGKAVKGVVDTIAKFAGLNKFRSVSQAIESITEKNVMNKNGEVIGRTITHTQKG